MMDASNDNGRSAIAASHEVTGEAKEASTEPKPTPGNPPDPTECETVESQSATPVSSRKIEANRRNAQRSTGPRSEAGKAVSRQNATKHGILAREVVITRGDYQEDPEEYARLLDEVTEEFQPEGVVEELEVQKIALYYWRKIRAVRYEHGAIRTRTADMRGREQRRREVDFERALNFNFRLEHSFRGLQWLIEGMEVAKQEALDGQVSSASLEGLMKYFPDDFLPNDRAEYGDGAAKGDVVGPPEYLRELVAQMEEQLARLRPLRDKAEQAEKLELESKIRAATIPTSGVVDKLVRYETSIERELDRALKRLEHMQKRRRENGRVSGAKPEGA